MQVLSFSVKGSTFAVPIDSIREIIELGELTTVPMMPRVMRGVMNLRGAVIPVIDLASRFSQGFTEPTARTCVVIFEVTADDGRHTLGALVDMVHEVLALDPTLVDPPPGFGTLVAPQFIRGMARLGERIVVLLELDRVLSVSELEALSEPSADREGVHGV